MSNLIKALEEKKEELKKLREKLTGLTPVGKEKRLRISCKGKSVQCYVIDPQNGKEHYIPQSQMSQVKRMVQNEYNTKLLEKINGQLKKIDKFEKTYHSHELADVYEMMGLGRKALVDPYVLSDKEYAKRWQTMEYKGKEIGELRQDNRTNRGEIVRSKSERIIADFLDREGIPYRYEAPLHLKGMGIVYPDFTILDVKNRREIYLEHLGMMDNEEYARSAVSRINKYIENGYIPGDNLLLSFETSKTTVDTRMLKQLLTQIFR